MSVTLLAIESSCDETSAAILQDGKILANVVATQQIHELYGGVVPELASREHQKNIVPVVHQALNIANIHKSDVNAVAFTRGPGLLGPLLVGVSFAKAFALANKIPMVEVNHMQAHILAHFIDEPKPEFPFLCLTISGGHTQIVLVESYSKFTIIGETQDDAVGEAFDKSAKLLGLPYPGGPLLDKYAQLGNPDKFPFPRVEMPEFSYSFSGIKTAILYFLQNNTQKDPDFIKNNLNDICASIQLTLTDILFNKLTKAAKAHQIKQIAIAGGVSANSAIRKRLELEGEKRGWKTFIPAFEYCTDNAAMIAMAGYFKYLDNDFVMQDISPNPRMQV
jgi:N6-L-threonylcarbamoyladenine synthase